MHSCDTFALGKDFYHEHKNFFAKNSDRPLGEAQPLCFYPRAEHKAGDVLQCTHLSIPQTNRTYAVMGCRPYWIWGFEMGVNECGLAIGNEAEGSRCEAETEEGMLGMDMLRLALERAATAREGVDVIAQMLTQIATGAVELLSESLAYLDCLVRISLGRRNDVVCTSEYRRIAVFNTASLTSCHRVG